MLFILRSKVFKRVAISVFLAVSSRKFYVFWLARQLSMRTWVEIQHISHKHGSWPFMIVWRSQTPSFENDCADEKIRLFKTNSNSITALFTTPKTTGARNSGLWTYWRVSGHRCPSNKAGYSMPVSGGWVVFMGGPLARARFSKSKVPLLENFPLPYLPPWFRPWSPSEYHPWYLTLVQFGSAVVRLAGAGLSTRTWPEKITLSTW